MVALVTLGALAACSDAADDGGHDALVDSIAAADGDATAVDDSGDSVAVNTELPSATEVGPDSAAIDEVAEVAETEVASDTRGDDTGPTTDPDVPDGEVQQAAPIHVTIYDAGGAPLPGIDVVFHDAAGHPLSVGRSDENGRVEVESAGVAMVTAIFAATHHLTTIQGLVAGQEVVIGTPARPAVDPGRSVTLEVHLPAAQAGADSYAIEAGCGMYGGGYADTFMTQESELCWTGDHRIDVFVAAMSATAGGAPPTPIAFALAPNVAVTEADSVKVVLDAWTTEWHKVPATLDAIPAGIDGISYEVSGRVGRQAFPLPWATGSFGADVGTKYTTNIMIPPGFFTALAASITITSHGASFVSEQTLAWEGASVLPVLGANVDQLRLPLFTAVTGAWSDSVPRVDWTADRSLAGMTAITADLFWSDGDVWSDWTIQGPGHADAFVIAPQLPETFAGLLPAASVDAPLASLQFVDLGTATTFAEYQAACGTDYGCRRLHAPVGTWERWGSTGSPDL